MQFGDLVAAATAKGYKVIQVMEQIVLEDLSNSNYNDSHIVNESIKYDIYYKDTYVAGSLDITETVKLLKKVFKGETKC